MGPGLATTKYVNVLRMISPVVCCSVILLDAPVAGVVGRRRGNVREQG